MFWKIFAVVVLLGVSGQVWFLNTDQSRNTVRIEATHWVENTLVKSRNLYRVCWQSNSLWTIICSEWKVAEKPPVFVPNESPNIFIRRPSLDELFEK